MAMSRAERAAMQRDWMNRDYAANPEKYRERAKRSYYARRDKVRVYAKQYRADNKDKLAAMMRDWQQKNPRRVKHNNLKRTGFTIDLYEQTIVEQEGLCAICSVDLSALPPKQVHADHCHHSGKPRGVLCHGCNTGIGGLRDDPVLLRKAIDYLEKHNLLT